MAGTIRLRESRLCSALLGAAVGLTVLGCSADDELPRQSISGQIKLDDNLLPKGIVHFYPRSAVGSREAVLGGAMIRNGRFSIPRDLGLVPGKYRVAVFASITGEKRRDKDKGPGKGETAEKEMIPPKYNSESQLEFEVKDSHLIKEMTIFVESK
jgi:hypothetical protein